MRLSDDRLLNQALKPMPEIDTAQSSACERALLTPESERMQALIGGNLPKHLHGVISFVGAIPCGRPDHKIDGSPGVG